LILALLIALPLTGTFHLPAGVTEVSSELKIPAGAHDLTITGSDHSTLRASANFHGRAIFSCQGCRRVRFTNFSIDGNRAALEKPLPVAPSDKTFSSVFPDNGILIEDADGLIIDRVDFANIANFAAIVSHSQNVGIDHVSVKDSGSLNAKKRNNTSGGILLEEGSERFSVVDSTFRNIRGNGVWTHSRYMAPRNRDGKILRNEFAEIGRDAIQVGHAFGIEVAANHGVRIGFPAEIVDLENLGTPVGIDTAGNVEQSVYERNRFEEIDGKCIDLDGFHDGAVRGNTCVNGRAPEDYPYGNFGISINNASLEMQSKNIVIENNRLSGMKFGGIFALGEGHIIRNNRMTHLNTAHCNETHAKFGCLAILGEPGFLESGIYLAKGGARPAPARNITIENNIVSGYKMAAHCIEAAPGVKLSGNIIRNNTCTNE
jgi:Right handed beta helix region